MGVPETVNLTKTAGTSRRSSYKSVSADRSAVRSSAQFSVSVKGISNFRQLPRSSPSSASPAVGDGSYVGRISRGGLFMFLLALTATAFVVTFPLYMVLTVYGPIELAVYSGDAEPTTCSDTWCSSLQCEDKGTSNGQNSSTTVVRLPDSEQLSARTRTVAWPPVRLDSQRIAELQLAVSDSSTMTLTASMSGGCAAVAVFIFSDRSDLDKWQKTGKSTWLHRQDVSCAGSQWGIRVANGGDLVVGIDMLSQATDVYLSLSATVASRSIGNASGDVVRVVCDSLAVPCSVPLGYREASQLFVATRWPPPPVNGSTVPGDGGVLGTVSCSCGARAGIYVAVFGGADAFIILVIIASYSYRQRRRWRCCGGRGRNGKAATTASDDCDEDVRGEGRAPVQITSGNTTETTLLLNEA